MKIFIDNMEVSVHTGANVLDALRVYYAVLGKKTPRVLPEITDGYGNTVATDGELSEGNRLYIMKS